MFQSTSLYIHIPFCHQRCDYCHFYVVTGLEKLIPTYVTAIKKELHLVAAELNSFEISTIYFGGGTPSLLNGEQVTDILTECRKQLKLKPNCEISLEANPENLNLDQLEKYFSAGINRLSLGLQAGQNKQLKSLGRTYSVTEFATAANLIKRVGFNNLNFDIMFGLPNQTLTDWQTTLELALSFKPQHISSYSLELDHQSVFGQKYRRGKLRPASDELNRQFYAAAKTKLAAAGFRHYELSNWAQPNFESQHNLNFWLNQPYFGIGAGAHSFFNHQTWLNNPIVASYIENVLADRPPRKELTSVSATDQQIEAVVLGLRLIAGLDIKTFEKNHGVNLNQKFSNLWSKLSTQKLIQITPAKIQLTDLGQDVYDQVAGTIWQEMAS